MWKAIFVGILLIGIAFIYVGENESIGEKRINLLPIYVKNDLNISRTYPVTSGFPFPKGVFYGNARLLDENYNEIPADFTVLSTWKDGSVKWLLVDFIANVAPNEEKVYYIQYGVNQSNYPPMNISENNKSILVNTGKIKFILNKTCFHFFDKVWININNTWKEIVKGGDIIVTNESGVKFYGRNITDIKVEKRGKVRSVIRIRGYHVNGSNSCLNFTMRIYVYANQSFLRYFIQKKTDYQF